MDKSWIFDDNSKFHEITPYMEKYEGAKFGDMGILS